MKKKYIMDWERGTTTQSNFFLFKILSVRLQSCPFLSLPPSEGKKKIRLWVNLSIIYAICCNIQHIYLSEIIIVEINPKKNGFFLICPRERTQLVMNSVNPLLIPLRYVSHV
jgi:hypothetical protein